MGLLVVAFGGVPSPAQGQGWYLGSELGAHVVPALGITGLSNDRASVCDEFINPQYATVTQTAGYEAYNCTGPDRRDDWVNQFVLATGLQTSWVLGYRFGADASGRRWRHVRTEVEYFYRATAYDQTVAVPGLSAGSGSVTADKLNQELQTATDYVGSVTAHTLFAKGIIRMTWRVCLDLEPQTEVAPLGWSSSGCAEAQSAPCNWGRFPGGNLPY